MSENLFEQRVRIANQAIAHEEPERIPIWINYGSTPHILNEDPEATFKDTFYCRERAKRSIIKFHEEFQPDVQLANLFSGKAEEIAGTKYIDWPGRPGTRNPDTSIYQVHEYEFMEQDEYPELLNDFTGFMLHKYIPRAFPNLKGLGSVLNPAPTGYMYVGQVGNLFGVPALEAYEKLIEIGKLQAEVQRDIADLQKTLAEKGFPPMLTGVGLVPYDILSNYFRGTVGSFEDLVECPDMMEKAVELFTDLQIANIQYFRFAKMPVKRMMFWMHKGMDGFMSPQQFETLYWKPFMKVVHALVDMGVTPIIYTEGKYDSRLEQMVDLPENKCVIHFENVKRENLMALYDTVRSYGKK